MARGRNTSGPWVPLSIRDRSRIVTWLWLHTGQKSWLNYNRGRRLARWLP